MTFKTMTLIGLMALSLTACNESKPPVITGVYDIGAYRYSFTPLEGEAGKYNSKHHSIKHPFLTGEDVYVWVADIGKYCNDHTASMKVDCFEYDAKKGIRFDGKSSFHARNP